MSEVSSGGDTSGVDDEGGGASGDNVVPDTANKPPSHSGPKITIPGHQQAAGNGEYEVDGGGDEVKTPPVEEPELEFDDTELVDAVKEEIHELEEAGDIGPLNDEYMLDSQHRSDDSTLFEEADFEEAFGTDAAEIPKEDDYADIARFGILEMGGDDSFGRKVILISACKLPSNKVLNHARFLKYLMYTLDKYVENDYTLVYFHYGLNSQNKPPVSWLWQAYKTFDRKYKKNLKALYLVHPTNFIRIVWQLFKPAISVKFGKKVSYVNYLGDLKGVLHVNQLQIPQAVTEHDKRLLQRDKLRNQTPLGTSFQLPEYPDTQQFNVSLQFLKEHNNGNVIPNVVMQCVEYLRKFGLETEGLFRRSPNTVTLKDCQNKFNQGIDVDLVELDDPHLAAVLLKKFLRELPEPVMTFELYDDIIKIAALKRNDQIPWIKQMFKLRLADDNYQLLKYVIHFLTLVAERQEMNKMSANNLAIVFGPNLVWSKGQASLSAMAPINKFTQLLITQYEELFQK